MHLMLFQMFKMNILFSLESYFKLHVIGYLNSQYSIVLRVQKRNEDTWPCSSSANLRLFFFNQQYKFNLSYHISILITYKSVVNPKSTNFIRYDSLFQMRSI